MWSLYDWTDKGLILIAVTLEVVGMILTFVPYL
jgi:hypothetical protein